MRCFSCGFLNSEQAMECIRCRNLLDPIAAAATVAAPVEVTPRPLETPAIMAFAPPVKPVTRTIPASFGFQPTRRNVVSADLDFLIESYGSTKLKEPRADTALDGYTPGPTSPIECSSCHRMLEPDRILIAQARNQQPICLDCQHKSANKEEIGLHRREQIRLVGGFVLAALATGACAYLTPQLGLDAAQHSFNWPMAVGLGAIIGLAARLGSLNKPGFGLQLISLFVTVAGMGACLYLGLNNLLGRTIDFGAVPDAFKALNPSALDYFWLGLGLLLAFVIPSGIFGGNDDALSASE